MCRQGRHARTRTWRRRGGDRALAAVAVALRRLVPSSCAAAVCGSGEPSRWAGLFRLNTAEMDGDLRREGEDGAGTESLRGGAAGNDEGVAIVRRRALHALHGSVGADRRNVTSVRGAAEGDCGGQPPGPHPPRARGNRGDAPEEHGRHLGGNRSTTGRRTGWRSGPCASRRRNRSRPSSSRETPRASACARGSTRGSPGVHRRD